MRLIDWIYPVGHVMITVNPYYDPNKIFKTHSWIRFAQGKTLVGVDPSDADFKTAEKTGGEKKHTLIESEMPAHYHNLQHTGNTSVMYVKGNVGSGNEYDFKWRIPIWCGRYAVGWPITRRAKWRKSVTQQYAALYNCIFLETSRMR